MTTDRDLTDTITGAVMLDEQGNALKVRELQKGSDDVTLRGDNGTSLHNVAAGTEDRDAVNVSQLKSTAKGLQNSIDGQGEAIKAIDSAQQQESKDRIAGYEQNSARITTVAEQKADKADVNEVRGALSQSTAERIAADADHDSKIADLYDTKANAAEVNEWLETKADKDALASEAMKREQATAQEHEALSQHDSRISAAQKSADSAGATADRANAGVERLDGQKADRSEVVTAQKAAITTANAHADAGLSGKVDTSTYEAGQKAQDDALAAASADAKSHADQAAAGAVNAADSYTDQKAASTLATAQYHADQQAAKAEGSANAHSDSELSKAKAEGNSYSDRAAAGAVTAANGYTDQKVWDARYEAINASINHTAVALNYTDIRADEEREAAVKREAAVLSESKAYTDVRMEQASKRQDALDHKQKQQQREYRAGVAGVAAMANIPTAREIGRLSIGAGVGSFAGTNAVAVGGSYRIDARTTVKGSFSTTGSDHVAGAGVAYEF